MGEGCNSADGAGLDAVIAASLWFVLLNRGTIDAVERALVDCYSQCEQRETGNHRGLWAWDGRVDETRVAPVGAGVGG